MTQLSPGIDVVFLILLIWAVWIVTVTLLVYFLPRLIEEMIE